MKELLDLLLPLGTGAVVGFVFALLKLPIPAPPTMSGIMGIVGIWLGFVLYTKFF